MAILKSIKWLHSSKIHLQLFTKYLRKILLDKEKTLLSRLSLPTNCSFYNNCHDKIVLKLEFGLIYFDNILSSIFSKIPFVKACTSSPL